MRAVKAGNSRRLLADVVMSPLHHIQERHHWQNGDMCLRCAAAGMLEGEAQLHKIIGYEHLAAAPRRRERPGAAPVAPRRVSFYTQGPRNLVGVQLVGGT